MSAGLGPVWAGKREKRGQILTVVRRDSGKIPGERDEKWAKQCSNGADDMGKHVNASYTRQIAVLPNEFIHFGFGSFTCNAYPITVYSELTNFASCVSLHIIFNVALYFKNCTLNLLLNTGFR